MEVYITIKFNNEEKLIEAPSSFEELNIKFRQKFNQPEQNKDYTFSYQTENNEKIILNTYNYEEEIDKIKDMMNPIIFVELIKHNIDLALINTTESQILENNNDQNGEQNENNENDEINKNIKELNEKIEQYKKKNKELIDKLMDKDLLKKKNEEIMRKNKYLIDEKNKLKDENDKLKEINETIENKYQSELIKKTNELNDLINKIDKLEKDMDKIIDNLDNKKKGINR